MVGVGVVGLMAPVVGVGVELVVLVVEAQA